MEKTIEQIQAESQQVQSFLYAVIEDLKGQVADMSHELAVQRAMNNNKEQAIQGKDANIQSLTAKIEELEQKIIEKKEGESE